MRGEYENSGGSFSCATGACYGYCYDTTVPPSYRRDCGRTIMASSSCTTTRGRTRCPRQPYFSNPDIMRGEIDEPIGTSEANNAHYLNAPATKAAITNVRKSTQSGGVIDNVFPSTASSILCTPVRISGFALGNGDNVVSVSLDGVPVNIIESQSKHEVVVLAATPSESFPAAGTGAIKIVANRTTATGETVADYVSTVERMFFYQPSSQDIVAEFETGTYGRWSNEGSVKMEPKALCTQPDCCGGLCGTVPTVGGPATGADGTAWFLRVQIGDTKSNPTPAAERYGVLKTTLNITSNCIETISELSFSYHMYTSSPVCRGELKAQIETDGVWTTILEPSTFQTSFDDPWIKLRHSFPIDIPLITRVRIVTRPYSEVDPDACMGMNAIGIDQVSISTTTACKNDNCRAPAPSFLTTVPTTIPTAIPSAGK